MQQYLDQLRFVLDHGVKREDRTGVGTISTFGLQARYDMRDGFPAVTTKTLAWKPMVSELLWFISGSAKIHDLKAIYERNKLWDLNFEDYCKRQGISISLSDGDMGRTYGPQWRRWNSPDGSTVDQLAEAIELVRHDPNSRRIIVNSWNPAEIDAIAVALPPCHSFFQFYVAHGNLSLLMYQRSADMFLGVPLNIASYALLLHMVATLTKLQPYEFIHSIGDAHIYLNAIQQTELLLTRRPFPLPTLKIEERNQRTIDEFKLDDFHLLNYRHHPPLTAKLAV